MHPFGSGFPVPDVELRFTSDEEGVVWSQMGSAKQHVKVKLAHGFDKYMPQNTLMEQSTRNVIVTPLTPGTAAGINIFTQSTTLSFEQLSCNPDFVISHDGDGDTHIDIMLFLEYLQELGTMHHDAGKPRLVGLTLSQQAKDSGGSRRLVDIRLQGLVGGRAVQ